MLAPDTLPELALDVGLPSPFAPDVALLDLVFVDSARQLASPVCSPSPLLALEEGLLEPGLVREFGLLELALEVGRLPPSLPSENDEDELEPNCCCRSIFEGKESVFS